MENRIDHAILFPFIAAASVASITLTQGCGGQGGEPVKEPVASASPPSKAPAAQAGTQAPAAGAEAQAPAPASTAGSAATTSAQGAAAPPPPKPACPEGMTLVPGGSFKMELRKDPVSIGPLCVDTNEVTADQYAACVKGGKCTADHLKCATQATFEAADKGNHPIVCVDFNQAVAYCTAQGKRLPTDEEWEWAARGGAEGWSFPWGNTQPKEQLCWSGIRTRNGTCAVGSTPAGDNPQGIHDLAGNVFEWTTSRGDARSKARVGRGGSWKDGLPDLMKASRPAGFEVTYRCGFLGIRCVLAALTHPDPPSP